MSVPAGIERPVRAGTAARRGVFASTQQHVSLLVAQELRRLERRTSLTPTQRAEVATALRRLTSRLVLAPLTTWKGDPQVAAELLGLPPQGSSKGSAS